MPRLKHAPKQVVSGPKPGGLGQAAIDTVRGAVAVLGPDLRVLHANSYFYRTFHTSAAEVGHRFVYELGHGGIPQLREVLEEVLPRERAIEDLEVDYETPSEGRRTLILNARRCEPEDRILLAIEDVTECRRIQEELRQSQKMEAIGYLAAGVAHDFNNLLTSMIGNADLLLGDLPENDPARSGLESIITGGERAADLTRQLLAYVGKGRSVAERVNLSDVVTRTGSLVHASIPANVEIRLNLDQHLPLLQADPSQMQQVVMNLLINAAEAIGKAPGVVSVRTGRQTLAGQPPPDRFLNRRVAPGEYVFLEVQDDGSGIDEQTMRRIFDPFFTTKFTGRGLGLAAVLGIVRLHNGTVQVHSVPGRGSTFRVLFLVAGKGPSPIPQTTDRDDLAGSGAILVVDDEEMIRNFTRSALRPYGYTVLSAPDGSEGVRLFQERSNDIRLVILDVAMPGMDGLAALERMRAIRPDIPVLICSGFGDVDVETRFAGMGIAGFFAKPFTVKQLARKVKECLTQPQL